MLETVIASCLWDELVLQGVGCLRQSIGWEHLLGKNHQQELDGRVPTEHLHQGGGLARACIGHDHDGVLSAHVDNLPLLCSESYYLLQSRG